MGLRICALLLIGISIPFAVNCQNDCPFEKEAPFTSVRTELYRGQQAFALHMLDATNNAKPNENIFFSPYSTYHCLLLAYFGSRGQSEKELIDVLRLDWAKDKSYVNRGYRIEKENRIIRSKSMPLQFSAADKIFFNNDIQLTSCIKDFFANELETMNFRYEADTCRENINQWIANITNNEIRDMLSAGDVTMETQMILANAAYFKGQWLSQFDPKETKREVFYTTNSKQSFVPMMHKRGTYNLAIDESLGAYVLDMPYLTSHGDSKESEMSMVIILPPFVDNSLDAVLKRLNPDSLEKALSNSVAREIDISLPKFEFEQNLELVPILRRMGINAIFSHNADLTVFTIGTPISFGDAKHVAKIKVDEEGSTASAATVFFSFRSARPVEPTKFECNHPFLFVIYDKKAKAVLFTGIYRDPMTQK